jgi:hypothetical protein
MKKYTKKYDKHNKNTKFIKKNLKKHKNRRNKTQKYIVRKNNRVKSNTYKTIQNGGAKTLEIVFLYHKDDKNIETFRNTIFNGLEKFFDKANVTKVKTISNFTDKYIKYFFRLPNTPDKNKLYESIGLEDPDIDKKFIGTNFEGIDTAIDIGYNVKKNNIRLIIYEIKNFNDKLADIFKMTKGIVKLKKDIESGDKSTITLITPKQIELLLQQTEIVIGLVKTKDPLIEYNPIKNIKVIEPINCIIKTSSENLQDRYVIQSLGYKNLGGTCYSNALIQLLKNIKNIENIIKTHIKTQPKDKKKKVKSIGVKLSKINYCYDNSNEDEDEDEDENLDYEDKKLYILSNLLKFMFKSNVTNKFFDATYYEKILDKLHIDDKSFTPTDQHDSQELFKLLALDFIEILQNNIIKTTYEFSKPNNFLYYTINVETFKNIDIILPISKSKYIDIQEIINENILGEEYNIKRQLPNNKYAKLVSNLVYFVNKNTEYIIIQLTLFSFINNKSEKKDVKITNLSNNICIKEIPEIVLDKYNNIKDNQNIDITINDININTCKNINFELISIVYHSGVTGGGHYINYSKQLNNDATKPVWICYDDKSKSEDIEVTNFDKHNFGSFTPYLFLYKRIEDTIP